MIIRDGSSIIVQHEIKNPSVYDCGDSLSRTGIMALCGSRLDQKLLSKFAINNSLLMRHPDDQKWNNPSLTSRDQVICAVASKNLKGSSLYYAKNGWVNKDYLDPGVRYYLYECAGVQTKPLWITILGPMFLFMALIWNTKIKPNEEMNQFVCICIVMGPWWLKKLVNWHPNLLINLLAYWSDWRDQEEIFDALKAKISYIYVS